MVIEFSCKKETTSKPTTIKDADGNVYTTVTIGTQTWMVENLKVTKYNDGTTITNVIANSEWIKFMSGAYCWYSNDINYCNPYGALYNWYAVGTGKLCPKGYHVATHMEWTALIDNIGGYSVAGGALKEAGNTHWLWDNVGATNSSGFTAVPGGYRYDDNGMYSGCGVFSYWWSSSAVSQSMAWKAKMSYCTNEVLSGTTSKGMGFSVRCVRD